MLNLYVKFSLRKLELSFEFISNSNLGYSNRINGGTICVQEHIILILFLIDISLFLLERSFISVGLDKRMDLIIKFFWFLYKCFMAHCLFGTLSSYTKHLFCAQLGFAFWLEP